VGSSRDGFRSSADWSITWAPGQKARKACTERRHGCTRVQTWLAMRNFYGAYRSHIPAAGVHKSFQLSIPCQSSRYGMSSTASVTVKTTHAHRPSPPDKLGKTPVCGVLLVFGLCARAQEGSPRKFSTVQIPFYKCRYKPTAIQDMGEGGN
jgi:hypothetical protein